MKIKILKNFKASVDGHSVDDFKEGEILEKDNRLTSHFLKWAFNNKGFTEEVNEEKMIPKIENKAIFNAPENKIEKVEIVLNEYYQSSSPEISVAPSNKGREVKIIKKNPKNK